MENPNDFLAPTPSTAMQNYGHNNVPLSEQSNEVPTWLGNLGQKIGGGTVRGSDRYFELLNQKNSQDYNSAEQAKARAFNLWTDSTRYQRSSEDLRKAGLNPLLLAEGKGISPGSVASSGSAESGTARAVPSDKNKSVKTSDVLKNIATTALALAKISLLIS